MTLPAWSQSMLPVDMEGAAMLLGVSRRFLVDTIREHPHYERRGIKKVFYPEHIALLRDALKWPDSKSKSVKESGTLSGLLTENAYEQALKLATSKEPRKRVSGSKRGFGNVLTMARKPSGPSKKQP